MYNQRFFHTTCHHTQTNPLVELIKAGKITPYQATLYPDSSTKKLAMLAPLILANKLSTYQTTLYPDSSVDKLARLTPLILSGAISTYQVTLYDEDSVTKLTGPIEYATQQHNTNICNIRE